MEFTSYLRFGAALVLVLGLIGIAAWAVRRFGLAGRLPAARSRGRRLAVVDVTPLDTKRRLVLVRRDGVEHLVLLGSAGDLVIERGIPVVPVAPAADAPGEPGEPGEPAEAGR
ncbi:MAG: flagellar biosynthetic protein FliO [Alphaproteobacteria bacterium]